MLRILLVGWLSLLPQAAMAVTGRVGTADGAPLSDAQVSFHVPDVPTAAVSAVTDGAGRYDATVAGGLYDVRVTPPPTSGFVAQTLPGRAVTGATTLDLLLVSSSVAVYRGRVTTAGGAGVPGVAVYLDGSDPVVTTVTAADGGFRMLVPPGTYRRRLEFVAAGAPPAGVPREFTLTVLEPVGVLVDLEDMIVLPEAVPVNGVVIDPTGAPVPDVALTTAFAAVVTPAVRGAQTLDAVTGADGTFSLQAFRGSVSLRVSPQPGQGVGSVLVGIEAGDSTTATVVLPNTPYSGLVETAAGIGIADVAVILEDASGFTEADVTDATGAFEMAVASTRWARSLATASPSVEPTVPREFLLVLAGALDLTQATAETLVLPATVQLSGTVRGPGGQAVPGVEIVSRLFDVMTPEASGTQEFVAISGSDGGFSVAVFPGTGVITARPPAVSGFGVAAAEVTVAAPSRVDITLPDTVYTADVRTAGGAPVGGVLVSLIAGAEPVSGVTEADGRVSLPLAPGVYDRRLDAAIPLAGLPEAFGVFLEDSVVVGSDLVDTLALPPAQVLSGVVVGPDGASVPGAIVTADFFDVVASGIGGVQGFGVVADGTGAFATTVFPGTGALLVEPPAGSDLLPFRASGISVGASDLEVGFLLQSTAEVTSATVDAGGSVGTDAEGDGATPSDPLETTVTVPVPGTVSIAESLSVLPPPEDYRFLGRQITISAPVSTPEAPLVIVFVLDASFVPAGDDETTIAVFRGGILVPECAGVPGTAAPDPCVAARERLADGDVRLTVYTSAASPWNLGVEASRGCIEDADCDDGIDCTADVCVAGTCTLTPEDEACGNGDACDGIEVCDAVVGCLAGQPVVCPDDDDPCTIDACNPDGSCGAPREGGCDDGDACTSADQCVVGTCRGVAGPPCADDGNPCTADVCDPATGACGAPRSGACDDGNPCTTADRCAVGSCVGDVVSADPFEQVACELERIPSTSCDPDGVAARLAARLRWRTDKALAALDRASGAAVPRRRVQALADVERQLVALLKRLRRIRDDRVSRDCTAVLRTIVQEVRAAVAQLGVD